MEVRTAYELTVKLGEFQHSDILHVCVAIGKSISNWQEQARASAAAFKADRITITALRG